MLWYGQGSLKLCRCDSRAALIQDRAQADAPASEASISSMGLPGHTTAPGHDTAEHSVALEQRERPFTACDHLTGCHAQSEKCEIVLLQNENPGDMHDQLGMRDAIVMILSALDQCMSFCARR